MDSAVFEINIDYEQAERFTDLLIKFLGQKWKPNTEFFNNFHVSIEGKILSIFKDEHELHLTVEEVELLFNNIIEEIDKFDINPDEFTVNISITMGVWYIKCYNGEEEPPKETD